MTPLNVGGVFVQTVRYFHVVFPWLHTVAHDMMKD
jgi:hypothetical protein